MSKAKIVIYCLVVLVIILAGALGYLVITKKINPAATQPTTQITNQTAIESAEDETADWKIYQDTVNGFEFKYPGEIELVIGEARSQKDEGISLRVSVYDINNMEDFSLGYDKNTFIKDREALEEGDPSTRIDFSVGNEILNIPGALGKKFTVLGRIDVCDVAFDRIALIYRGNNVIRLSWTLNNNDDIIKNNPAYFTIDQAVCGDDKKWKENNTFYSDLLSGTTDKISQEWFTDFDTMLSTFKFIK